MPPARDAPTEPARFSPALAVLVLAYLLGAAVLWYGTRGTWFGRQTMVVPIYGLGALLFLTALPLAGVGLRHLNRETWLVALTSLLFLAVLWHFGRREHYAFWFGAPPPPGGLSSLKSFIFFSAAAVLARMGLPMLTARFLLGRGPRDYGYGLHGTFALWWVYVLALLAGVTAAVVASRAPSFLSAYPRCRDVISDGKLAASAFAVYQVAYGMVFVSGEAFWRGYILFGLERQLGRNALFFMIIPYVVSHFGKPPLETFGAVLAGLLLGYLALRHRSFWLGVVVHWGVAIAMDIAALIRSGVTLTWN